MANAKLSVTGMTCGHCQAKVEQALKGVTGVYTAIADLEPRLDRAVHLREKPLGELVELRFSHLIRHHLDERVVAALGQRAHRKLADRAAVREPPRRLLGRHETGAEERFRRLEHLLGARTRPMKVFHACAQAGLKRRNVKLFNTTDRLDHAIAALAITGDKSTPVNGYSAPAAIGMPTT